MIGPGSHVRVVDFVRGFGGALDRYGVVEGMGDVIGDAIRAHHVMVRFARGPCTDGLYAFKLSELIELPVKPTVYTASKTIHAPRWRALRDSGVRITSTWIDEAGTGETQDFADLWLRCVRESSESDVLLAYRQPGEILKGAFVEIGCALSQKKPVVVAGDWDQMSFLHHPAVLWVGPLEQGIWEVKNMIQCSRCLARWRFQGRECALCGGA